MLKKYLFLLSLFPVLFSCSGDKEKAQVYLERAQTSYDRSDYSFARQMLDSLNILFPQELELRREALHLLRRVELKEEERQLLLSDSLLASRMEEADRLKQEFVFEKDPQYDDLGKYFDKRQKIENKVERSYIRSWVDEHGDLFLASVFYGKVPLKHNQLKVSRPDGNYVTTQVIPFDGGLNYSFSDFGMTTEVVTYGAGRDEGVALFICENKDQTLKAEYLGGRKFSLTIPAGDKSSLSRTVDLSVLLTDIERLKKEKEKAEKRIEYLKTKI